MNIRANKPVKHGLDHLPGGQDPIPFPPAPGPVYMGGDVLALDAFPATVTSSSPDVPIDSTHGQWYISFGSAEGLESSVRSTITPGDRWFPSLPSNTMPSGQLVLNLIRKGIYLIHMQISLVTTGAMASDVRIEAVPVGTFDGATTWGTSYGSPNNRLFQVGTSHETPGGAVDGDVRSATWCVTWPDQGGGSPSPDYLGVTFNLYADPTSLFSSSGSLIVVSLTEGNFTFTSG